MSKRKEPEGDAVAPVVEENFVEITPLGAGQEVGRSCIILQYLGKRIMLDCGIHPSFSGLNSLPYLDEVDLTTIDMALITHFHLDHCAAVPFLIGKTAFKGRVFMTHPTKAIFSTLLRDFCKVSKGGSDESLYGEKEVDLALEKIEVIDFHQTIEVDGVKVTPYRAGHVLGAAMFMVEIGGMKALYTGDYSRVADRHLSAADIPPLKPDIVIVESTYGVSRHLPREERERRFLNKIRSTVVQGGRVLLPVVALGRAQELLLMIDEYWDKHPELHHVPVYQASGLSRKALTIYQTYIEMMNDDIKYAFQVRNPFVFKHVQPLVGGAHTFDDTGACVVMATPSMLQSGLSRDLFDMWCEDERNAIIIADFAVQGTLAREVLSAPSYVSTKAGVRVPFKMSAEAISFSAHADYDQTSGFLDTLRPPHVVLVHGEANEMMRLRNALERNAKALGITRNLYTPKVAQTVKIAHKPLRTALVIGALAEKVPQPGQMLRGVWVKTPTGDLIMDPKELHCFTKLSTGKVKHRQAIALNKPFSEVRLALEVMFEGVEGAGHLPVCSAKREGGEQQQEEEGVQVGDIVLVLYRPANAGLGYPAHVVLEWEGGAIGDMVADAVVAVLLQAAGEPAGAAEAEEARRQALLQGDIETAVEAELQLMAAVLRAQFGIAHVQSEMGQVVVEVDGQVVIVDHKNGKVTGEPPGLRDRVEKAVRRVSEAMRPCTLDFEE